MEYLLNTVVTVRVHEISDVENLHNKLKHDQRFELISFSYTTKDIKVKSEVVDQYQLVKYKLLFTNEKDPIATYNIDFIEAE